MSYASNGSGAPSTNRINNSGYSFDSAGNIENDGSLAYTYDAASRLKTAGGDAYQYDGDGHRVRNQASGYSNALYYLWSSVLNQPVVEIDSTTPSVFRAYVYNPGGQMPLALQSYNGNFYWLHADVLGSGRKMTDSSGTVIYRGEYDPHGQMVYEWASGGATYLNSHKFTGHERDWSTNLNNARARTYNHNRARFMQPDPLGLGAADLSNPQSLNLYSYVENDPVNYTDPTGLLIQFCVTNEYGYFDGNGVSHTVSRTECYYMGGWGYGGGGGGGVIDGGRGGGGGGGTSGEQQSNTAPKSNFKDCFEKYRFTSAVGTMFGPTAETVAQVIDVTSTISFAGDMLATAAKAGGKTLGKPQPYASGLNWVFRRISSGSVRGVLTTVGGAITTGLAVTAAFTAGYDLSIAAQCAAGILK